MLKRRGHGKMLDWYVLGVILYEMIVGRTPQEKGSKNTCADQKVSIPRFVSPEAADLIRRLLHRTPEKRIGAQEGGSEIKSHPFFATLNWD
jgi:serine/threonine protein kinase